MKENFKTPSESNALCEEGTYEVIANASSYFDDATTSTTTTVPPESGDSGEHEDLENGAGGYYDSTTTTAPTTIPTTTTQVPDNGNTDDNSGTATTPPTTTPPTTTTTQNPDDNSGTASPPSSTTTTTTTTTEDYQEPCLCPLCRPDLHQEWWEAYWQWLEAESNASVYYDNQPIKRSEQGSFNNEFVNLFTGLLTLKHDDIATTGALANAEVSHYYTSVREKPTCQTFKDYHCGQGWKLSLHQCVESAMDGNYRCVYIDAVGKKHYFIETSGHGVMDTGGLNLTYRDTPSGGSCITDRNGNEMTFDTFGRLVALCDSNGNTVRYIYEGDRICKAIDSFGRELLFTYNARGLLSEIQDPELRSVTFTYNDANELIRITEPDGATSCYSYDENGHITETKDPYGVKIVYTYEENGDKILRTDKYATVASTAHNESTSAQTPVSEEFSVYEYRGKRSTAVMDRSGIRHVYVFDEYGRCINEYEDSLVNGTQEKGQVTGTVMYQYSKQKKVFASSLTATDEENPNLLSNSTFELDAVGGTVPANWNKVGGSNADCISTDACIDGTKSFMFAGSYGSKYLMQDVPITDSTLKHGDIIVLSAWTKAAPIDEGETTVKAELRAVVHYELSISEECSASFDTEFDGWQYIALPIRVNPERKPTSVSVYLDCSNNEGAVYFDNARLVNTRATIANYEESLSELQQIFGRDVWIVERVTSYDGVYTTITEYDASYLPVREIVRDADSNSFVSVKQYDAHRNLIAEQDYRGIVTLCEYTDNGQPTRTRTYHSDDFNTAESLVCPEACFVKEYTYDKNGEFVVSESDARSSKLRTQYDYNSKDGTTNHITDQNGVRTTYAYDHKSGAVTMVSTSVDGQNNAVAYGYTDRYLTAITHNGFEYLFEYDGFGRQSKITVGGALYAQNTYTLTDTTTVETTYANGDSLTVTTDRHQSPIKKTYTTAEQVTYNENASANDPSDPDAYLSETVIPAQTETLIESEYDELGKPTVTIDNAANIVYNYKYDELGEIVEEKRNNTSFKLLEYDEHRRLEKTTVHASDETLVYTPIYDTREDGVIYADNVLCGMRLEGVFTQSVDKDKQGRPTRSSLSVGDTSLLETEFGYLTENNRLTTVVERLTHRVCGTEQNAYTYTYDANGNITAVHDKQDALIVSYVYDGLNRLTRENNFVLGKTYTYRYDAAGNILSKSTYAVTSGAVVTPETVKLYGYASEGWKERLISYDGTAITYDDAGNPLLYRGHTLGWSRIRLLTSWDSLSFAYNANGIRTRKGNTTYELDGDSIISETTNGNTIRYYYGNGGIVGFRYNGARYYYEKNLQGDITAIYSENGQLVGSYTYDAWGNHTIDCDVNGIASANPFRYRAYYYDTETGLYYVNSRYYDPEVGRWINPEPNIDYGEFDESAGLLGYNVFTYCANNPVMFKDETGESITLACVLIGAGIGLIVGAVGGSHYAKHKKNLTPSDGWDYWKYVVGFGVAGGAVGALAGWGVSTAIGTNLATGSSRVIYSSWQAAEDALRNICHATKAAFDTPWGKRIVDAFSKNIIREAKYGYQGLSKFIQQEINKDIWILNNTSVKSIEWHFFESKVSNTIGPSDPLLKELLRHGIKVFFH